MFFSRPSRVVIISMLVFLAGCKWHPFSNFNLHDHNPPPGALSANLGQYSCMSEVGKKVTSYLNGDMTEPEIAEFANCINTALGKFMFLTVGTVDGGYSPNDLASFLNRVYLSNQPLTPDFVKEIMDLKVVILGGSNSVITRSEINKMMELVGFLRNQAIANLPYVRLYSHLDSVKPAIDRTFLEDAKAQLHKSAVEFAYRLQANNTPYSLESLNRLIDQAQKFLKWRTLHPDSLSADVFTQLVRAHKYVITGRLNDVIQPNEWSMLFDSITSAYSAEVNFKVLYRGSITYGPNLDILIATAHDIFQLVGETIDQIPEKTISFASTDALLQALSDAHFLPRQIREKSLVDLWHFAVSKAFRNPLSQNKGAQINGLSWSQLVEIENEFNIWADSQSYLSERAQYSLGFRTIPSEQVFRLFQNALAGFDLSKLPFNGFDQRGREIQRIVANVPPFFRDGDERAYIMPRDELPLYNVKNGMTDLTHMNIIHTLARLLMRGFASDQRIIALNSDWTKTGVTEDELESFYTTFRGLGIDLKFMDPRKREGAGRKAFQEAKLFTYDGDGLSAPGSQEHRLLSFNQIMEYLALLWSGGQVRNSLYTELRNVCQKAGYQLGDNDPFGEPKINRECFDTHFFDNHLSEVSNLPGLQKALDNLSDDRRREVLSNLEDIARIPCTDGRYIEFTELGTIATVLHYVESIFTVYDRNRDNYLDQYEVMEAFSRFQGYIARQALAMVGHNLSIGMQKAVFAFLIEKQRVPTWTDLAVLGWENIWRYNNDPNQFRGVSLLPPDQRPNLPHMLVDRAGLLSVLRVLADATNQPQSATACLNVDTETFRRVILMNEKYLATHAKFKPQKHYGDTHSIR